MSTPMTKSSPKAKVTTPSDREIRIERVFAAPREVKHSMLDRYAIMTTSAASIALDTLICGPRRDRGG